VSSHIAEVERLQDVARQHGAVERRRDAWLALDENHHVRHSRDGVSLWTIRGDGKAAHGDTPAGSHRKCLGGAVHPDYHEALRIALDAAGVP
jgi:hypothetical protein